MEMKKLACVLVLGGAFVAVGCGGDDGDSPDGGTDAGPPALCETEPCMPRTYVINYLDVGQENPMGEEGVVPGFNLDMRVSDDTDAMGCFQQDFTSPAPDNETGVDNQLGPILGSLGMSIDVSGTIAENIADGSLILFVELLGVDSIMSDRNVQVNLLLGQLPAGVTMPLLNGERLAPGQTFDILEDSYLDGGAGTMARISVGGSIVNGRLNAGPVTIPLSLPVMDVVLNLTINRARLRFTVGESMLTNGIIGGSLDIDEVVAAVMAIPDLESYVELLMNLLEMNADLDPDAAMMGDCQSVSLGLIFDATTGTKGSIVPRASM